MCKDFDNQKAYYVLELALLLPIILLLVLHQIKLQERLNISTELAYDLRAKILGTVIDYEFNDGKIIILENSAKIKLLQITESLQEEFFLRLKKLNLVMQLGLKIVDGNADALAVGELTQEMPSAVNNCRKLSNSRASYFGFHKSLASDCHYLIAKISLSTNNKIWQIFEDTLVLYDYLPVRKKFVI